MNKHSVFQLVAAATIALALWLIPADADSRSCPTDYPFRIAHGCRNAAGNGVACDAGYQGQFSRATGRFVGKCVSGPIVRGG